MDTQKIVKEIESKYPGKKIILDPQDNPTEIICEIEPTEEHPEKSVALAVVGWSKPHYHKECTEIYEAIKGELTVYKEGKAHVLKEGERVTIEPGVVHNVEGDEAWFLTYSNPGWRRDDHIVLEGDGKLSHGESKHIFELRETD